MRDRETPWLTEPSLPTIKRLFTKSGDRCAFEACETPLFDPATGACIGVVCHVSAAKPGGPRYDENQSDEERNGFENLVLMCANHARVIDHRGNEALYSIDLLLKWKEARESGTVAPTSDAIARALMGYSTGISMSEVAGILSEIQRYRVAADEEGAARARRAAMYREYTLSHDGITAGVVSGNDPLPREWVDDWERRHPR